MKYLTGIISLVCLVFSSISAAKEVALIIKPGQKTSESDLVFTVVTGIDISGQAWLYQQNKLVEQNLLLSPVAQWEQRFSEQYLGFLLSSRQENETYRWDGDLQVYFGKISSNNDGTTQPWPQSRVKDRSYQQTIESARRFKLVTTIGSTDNLRVYSAPTRTSWAPPDAQNPDGRYRELDSMVILYIDPATGGKHSAIYSSGSLYKLRNNPTNPTDQTKVSLWYTVRAGAIDFTYLEAAEEERGIPVNLYTTQIFVFDESDDGGFVYGANENEPVLNPSVSGDAAGCFNVILRHVNGEPISPEDLNAAKEAATEIMQVL